MKRVIRLGTPHSAMAGSFSFSSQFQASSEMIDHLKNAFQRFSYLTNTYRSTGQVSSGPGNVGLSAVSFRLLPVVMLTLFLGVATPSSVFAQDAQDSDDLYEDEMGMEGYGDDEMGMEGYGDDDLYGDGSYGSGYGGGRRSRGGSPQELYASQLQAALISAMESTNLASLADPEAAPPVESGPVLLNEATVAYAKGDFPLAMNLFFGHIVAEYDKAQSQLALVKATRLMKQRSQLKGRPVWNLRWGISYMVRGDATDPQPIEETAAREAPTRVARAGGGRGRGGFGGFDGEMGMDEEYDMEMDERGEEMGMDEDGMDEQYEMEMQELYGEGMGRGRRGRPGAVDAPAPAPTPGERLAQLERTMLGPDAEKELTTNLGAVAAAIAAGFDERFAEGDFGRAMTDVSEESGTRETVSEDFVDLLDSTEPLPLWRPGLLFMGQGDSDDVTKVAQKAGVDMLIHIDIYLKALQGEYTDNTSRCRLIHVPSGKSLGVSKPMSSLKFMQQSRAKGTGSKEFIDEQLENYWSIVDRYAQTTEMPQLTAEYAKIRVGELMASGGGHNLRTLAEIRFYQSQQLLTEDEVVQAFDIVGGEEALQLLFGTEEEKLQIAHKWAAGKGGESN